MEYYSREYLFLIHAKVRKYSLLDNSITNQ